MDFRLELAVKPLPRRLKLAEKVALVGSCFTEHMSERLRHAKFEVLENPNGIVFNPMSIQQAIQGYVAGKTLTQENLFYYNELWTSWDFHGQFAHPNKDTCVEGLNASVQQAHHFLKSADWLIVTFGSAFVYELATAQYGGHPGQVVANCHKVPANHFVHRLASVDEVVESTRVWVQALRQLNPAIQIIFTISPVRHYREGLVENNRSKGTLHVALHEIIQQHTGCYYFPAYELLIDDLRDYRFYAEDLVHPNFAATRYVWEKFCAACIDAGTLEVMEQLEKIRLAVQHKPHHPGSPKHQAFLETMWQKTKLLQQQYPLLNLENELLYFSRRQ